MRSAVLVPTYNESDNLPILVREIRATLPDLHVVVIDDNSPDGTGQIADRLAAADSSIHPLHRPTKLGLGTAHIAGIRYALDAGAEFILTMDADFSHSPRYLPAMLQALSAKDVVIGSRYVRGGGTRFCSVKRQGLSLGANAIARTVLGLRARDCTAGFRGYRRTVLESIPLDRIFSNGYSFLIEMLYHCQRGGWRIGEIPIIFEDRRRGVSKISREEIVRAMGTVATLRFRGGRLPTARLQPRLASSWNDRER